MIFVTLLVIVLFVWTAFTVFSGWVLGKSARVRTKVLPPTTEIPLPRTELRAAFNVASDNKLWRAVLQLNREAQEEAKEGAEKSVANHGICASCVGGGEFLTRLRDRMILEREAAIKGEAVKQ